MLTIGRLGTLAAIEPKTLRYYDRVGLVRPSTWTAAGYRLYGEDTVERLYFIRLAKALRISLTDIRRILAVRDEAGGPCQHGTHRFAWRALRLRAGSTGLARARTSVLLRGDVRMENPWTPRYPTGQPAYPPTPPRTPESPTAQPAAQPAPPPLPPPPPAVLSDVSAAGKADPGTVITPIAALFARPQSPGSS